jgi:hypothetical protein
MARQIVGSNVGFRLHDAADSVAIREASHQQATEKVARHRFRIACEEGSREILLCLFPKETRTSNSIAPNPAPRREASCRQERTDFGKTPNFLPNEPSRIVS